MFIVECIVPGDVRLRIDARVSASIDVRFDMLAAEARRLAAELIVAAERAERLESDMRAPG